MEKLCLNHSLEGLMLKDILISRLVLWLWKSVKRTEISLEMGMGWRGIFSFVACAEDENSADRCLLSTQYSESTSGHECYTCLWPDGPVRKHWCSHVLWQRFSGQKVATAPVLWWHIHNGCYRHQVGMKTQGAVADSDFCSTQKLYRNRALTAQVEQPYCWDLPGSGGIKCAVFQREYVPDGQHPW